MGRRPKDHRRVTSIELLIEVDHKYRFSLNEKGILDQAPDNVLNCKRIYSPILPPKNIIAIPVKHVETSSPFDAECFEISFPDVDTSFDTRLEGLIYGYGKMENEPILMGFEHEMD